MSTFYRGVDLYLNTSIHEGIPMSVLEAMAHGLPVVAPNVGGISEIIDQGVEGYLLEDRDPKASAEKFFLLYENKGLRERMSHAAREKVVRAILQFIYGPWPQMIETIPSAFNCSHAL
jgi:glycosyltransferase involved in cell wall biosynthesis